MRVIHLVAVLAATLIPVWASGQTPFETRRMPAQARDAVVASEAGRVYVAAYDRNEIWVYAPASWERLAQLPVGEGPARLALSPDEQVLACLNQRAQTVSLIRLPEQAAYATVAVGEAPSAIAAMPDGRFAVANAFGDSVTVINPHGEGQATTLKDAAVVPVDIAASKDYLAIAGRGDRAIVLFSRGETTASRRLAVPSPPKRVVLTGDDRLTVATESGLCVIDMRSGKTLASKELAAIDLCAGPAGLWVLAKEELLLLDARLDVVRRVDMPAGVCKIAAGNGVLVGLAPAERHWYVRGTAGAALPEASVAESPVAEPPHFAVVEADAVSEPPPAEEQEGPVPSEEAEAAPVELAPPEPAEEEVAESPAEVDEATPVQAARPAEEESPPPAEEAGRSDDAEQAEPVEITPDTPVEPTPEDEEATTESVVLAPDSEGAPASTQETQSAAGTGHVRQHPLPTGGLRAPIPRRRPSADPLSGTGGRSLTDALLRPTELGASGAGFESPDWTEPLRDVKSERMRTDLNTGRTRLEDNVHLRLGNMYFESDAFEYSMEAGEYYAEGNVLIEQEFSTVRAEEIRYEVPTESAIPAPALLEIEPGEQERARRRLSLGRVFAKNIEVIEPTRELRAEHLQYDFSRRAGELVGARGSAGILYYGAERLRLNGPGSYEAEDLWLTTCDREHPHYRLRVGSAAVEQGKLMHGTKARLMMGNTPTPLFLPKWRSGGPGLNPWMMDFDTGRRAEIGYYVNVGQRYPLSPDLALGPRIFATEKEGVGFGADLDYDYMETPASRLYRTKGKAHGFHTTKDRGYVFWRHRYEYGNNLTLRMQAEHWSDRDFYKDFFYDKYRNRTSPRSFANLTYRKDNYIATGTVRGTTHGWVRETERLPEATFHLLERPLLKRLYLTFDTVNGYNDRQPYGDHGMRTSNTARLTYDLNLHEALGITPFVEAEGTWYSRERRYDESTGRASALAGVTLQSRFHRAFDGFWGFSGFKHLVVPSVTYSYRPETSLSIVDTPHFDALDSVFGRSRLESKLDNLIYGRDAETNEVWQVARLSLYQGTDFWNETRETEDYEIEIDVRPRPWWGFQLAGERHIVDEELNLDSPAFWELTIDQWYEDLFGDPPNPTRAYDFTGIYGDYNRVLTQLYYDKTAVGGNLSGRVGYAYTESGDRLFNREVLYGLGCRLGEKWGVSFEHRYDFDKSELTTQTYELRRSWHCWESSIRFRDRESGFDVDLAFYVQAFPATKLKF